MAEFSVVEAKQLLHKCTYGKVNLEAIETLKQNIDNQVIRDVLVYEMQKEKLLKLSKYINIDDILQAREVADENVVNNFTDFDFQIVKDSLASLIAGTNAQNLRLQVVAILDRAKSVPEFEGKIKGYRELLDLLNNFFAINEETYDQDTVQVLIQEIYLKHRELEDSNSSIGEVLQNLKDQARKDFKEDLLAELLDTKKRIMDDNNRSEVVAKDGTIVPVFTVSAKNQELASFRMFIHSSPHLDYYNEPNAREVYEKTIGEYRDNCCYSLISEYGADQAFSKRNIIFGYFDLSDAEVWHANTSDGQTNQWMPIEREKHCVRQQFVSIDEMAIGDGSHSEIVMNKPEKVLPDYLISYEFPPDERVIEVANNFNLPIVYIDAKSYEGTKNTVDYHHNYDYANMWFDNSNLMKYSLAPKTQAKEKV